MAYTPKGYHANLTTSSLTAHITVPAGKSWLLKQIILTNYHASSAALVNVALASGQHLIKDRSLVAGETFVLDLTQVMDTATSIQADTSVASSVRMHVGYVEFP